MSDNYVFEDSRPQGEEGGAAEAAPLDPAHISRYAQERIQAHEETPLSLTPAQRTRLWVILRDELGPARAINVMKRIEAEA